MSFPHLFLVTRLGPCPLRTTLRTMRVSTMTLPQNIYAELILAKKTVAA